MNIVVISHDSFWPLRGGGGLRVYWIVKELLKRKHEVTVLAPFISMKGAREEFPKAKLVNLGNVSRFGKRKELMYTKVALRILRKLKNHNPDVMYAHNAVSAFPALLHSKQHKIPLLYDIDDFTLGLSKVSLIRKYGPYLECFIARHSTKVIAAYNAMASELRKHRVKKVKVIRHGVNLKVFKPKKTKKEDLIVYMGGVESHDGTLLIPQAAKIILKKHPKMKFLIIGAGSYLERTKNLVKELRLEKHFIFKGWMKHEEVPKYLNKAKVGLITHLKCPATEVGLPLKGFEYMAMRLPFVAPNLKGMREELGNNERALLYKWGSPDDLAEKVLALLKDKKRQQQQAEKGRVYVEQYCDWPVNARKMADILTR